MYIQLRVWQAVVAQNKAGRGKARQGIMYVMSDIYVIFAISICICTRPVLGRKGRRGGDEEESTQR